MPERGSAVATYKTAQQFVRVRCVGLPTRAATRMTRCGSVDTAPIPDLEATSSGTRRDISPLSRLAIPRIVTVVFVHSVIIVVVIIVHVVVVVKVCHVDRALGRERRPVRDAVLGYSRWHGDAVVFGVGVGPKHLLPATRQDIDGLP